VIREKFIFQPIRIATKIQSIFSDPDQNACPIFGHGMQIEFMIRAEYIKAFFQ